MCHDSPCISIIIQHDHDAPRKRAQPGRQESTAPLSCCGEAVTSASWVTISAERGHGGDLRPEDVEPRAAAAASGDLPQHRGQVQPEPPGAGPRQPQPRDPRAGGQLALAARHEARHGPQLQILTPIKTLE